MLKALLKIGVGFLLLLGAVLPSAPLVSAGVGPLVALAVGGSHTCALTGTQQVFCWGANDQGQSGNPEAASSSSIPLAVAGLEGAIELSAGTDHTCALMEQGSVRCWGRNGFGQLGNGGGANSATPADVCEPSAAVSEVGGPPCEAMSGVVSLSAGGHHTCAIRSDGEVLCWGINQDGELGDDTLETRRRPVAVLNLERAVVQVSSGDFHTCALLSDLTMRCWGYNFSGQLGDGTTQLRKTPVDVQGVDSAITAISAGGFHTCAITVDGSALCWGENLDGQLGDGTNEDSSLPQRVVGLDAGAQTISSGRKHTCAVFAERGVLCWGQNNRGQLGDGSLESSSIPVQVESLHQASLLGTRGVQRESFGHTCAFAYGGGLHCWGSNGEGQLGNAMTLDSHTPVAVRGMSPDLDCDGSILALDVLLLLQFHGGLLHSLACDGADVDGDGEVTSLDGVLVLQFIAGLQ